VSGIVNEMTCAVRAPLARARYMIPRACEIIADLRRAAGATFNFLGLTAMTDVVVETCLFDAPVMLPVSLDSLAPHASCISEICVIVNDADASEDLAWSDLGFSCPPPPPRLRLFKACDFSPPSDIVILPACAAAGPAFDVSLARGATFVETSKRMTYVIGDEDRCIRHDPVADLFLFGDPSQHTGSPGRQHLLKVRDSTKVLDLAAGPHVPWLAHMFPAAQVYCVGHECDIAPLRTASTSKRLTFVKGHAYYPTCITALIARAPFDVIRDHDPDRSLSQACFAIEEYPKLLVPSRGVFISENVSPDWIPPLLMSINSRIRPHARVRGSSLILDLSLARDSWIPYTPKKTFYEWLTTFVAPEVVVVLGADDSCAYASALAAPTARVSYVVDPSTTGFPPDSRAPNVSMDVIPESKSAAVHFRHPIDILHVVSPQTSRVYAAWESKVQIDGVVVWDWKTVDLGDVGADMTCYLAFSESPDLALKTTNASLFREVLDTWSDFVMGPPPKK
jgi:hypothetical protein